MERGSTWPPYIATLDTLSILISEAMVSAELPRMPEWLGSELKPKGTNTPPCPHPVFPPSVCPVPAWTKMSGNYYAILEVAPTADDAVIKTSYRRLAKLRHPDKNPNNPQATAQFQNVCRPLDTAYLANTYPLSCQSPMKL